MASSGYTEDCFLDLARVKDKILAEFDTSWFDGAGLLPFADDAWNAQLLDPALVPATDSLMSCSSPSNSGDDTSSGTSGSPSNSNNLSDSSQRLYSREICTLWTNS